MWAKVHQIYQNVGDPSYVVQKSLLRLAVVSIYYFHPQFIPAYIYVVVKPPENRQLWSNVLCEGSPIFDVYFRIWLTSEHSGGLAHRETGRFPGGPLLQEVFRALGRRSEFISLIIS